MTRELSNREDRGHPANLRFSGPRANVVHQIWHAENWWGEAPARPWPLSMTATLNGHFMLLSTRSPSRVYGVAFPQRVELRRCQVGLVSRWSAHARHLRVT